jgi:adenine deaminase
MKTSGIFVDLAQRSLYPAIVEVMDGRISAITPTDEAVGQGYLMPGFVDAHVHIESSMLPPSEFARMTVVHGTVATVSDPHEIANVLGVEGVHFMLDDARRTPLKYCFGAPSCIPATTFETAGASLDAEAVTTLLEHPDIGYLSEMMNFPGVLHRDPEVMAKIAAAQRIGKPIDGHAPGLRGAAAEQYFGIGISTDHECFTYEEGLEKARLGVHILIREGSAARNFESLWPLLIEFPQQTMFCSDDKHPDDLVKGHINTLAARAVAKGCDVFDVLRAACWHPVQHYRLSVGLLRPGDPADFIRVADLTDFTVLETWIDGQLVAANGQSLLPRLRAEAPNHFNATPVQASDFQIMADATTSARVIRALDGEIVTGHETAVVTVENGCIQTDTVRDFLKIAVVNRYNDYASLDIHNSSFKKVAVGLIRGFGLQRGALASSVAHDSHNIVAVGTDDSALCIAVNAVIEAKGGISATDGLDFTEVLPLPIGGLMSQEDGYTLAQQYEALDTSVKKRLGCTLKAPFMTLSFMALPVIPSLKMTDLGLFDVEKFAFTSVDSTKN